MKSLAKTISVPRVVRNNDCSGVEIFGARVDFLVGPQLGGEPSCLLKGTVPPGVSIPIHSHDAIETMFILSGGIEMIVEDAGTKRWVEANAGDRIEIPSNAKHGFRNSRQIPMTNLVLTSSSHGRYLLWSEFLAAVRTNKAQAERALGAPIFDYYAQHPEEAAIFREAMQDVSEGVANTIAGMLETSTYSVAVDVGGADGALVHSLMERNPQLRGIVLDRPEVAAAAAAAAKARGLAERTQAMGGDFFKSVPEGDLYLLRFILHDWDDADAIRILKNCRRSMRPGARLVVIEAFSPEPGERRCSTMATS